MNKHNINPVLYKAKLHSPDKQGKHLTQEKQMQDALGEWRGLRLTVPHVQMLLDLPPGTMLTQEEQDLAGWALTYAKQNPGTSYQAALQMIAAYVNREKPAGDGSASFGESVGSMTSFLVEFAEKTTGEPRSTLVPASLPAAHALQAWRELVNGLEADFSEMPQGSTIDPERALIYGAALLYVKANRGCQYIDAARHIEQFLNAGLRR